MKPWLQSSCKGQRYPRYPFPTSWSREKRGHPIFCGQREYDDTLVGMSNHHLDMFFEKDATGCYRWEVCPSHYIFEQNSPIGWWLQISPQGILLTHGDYNDILYFINVGKTRIDQSPNHHRWYAYHSQPWVVYGVYGIVLPTWWDFINQPEQWQDS